MNSLKLANKLPMYFCLYFQYLL